MDKLYIVAMFGCTEPELIGPFNNDEERIVWVKENLSTESCCCRLLIDENGEPHLGSFVNSEIEIDEEEQ